MSDQTIIQDWVGIQVDPAYISSPVLQSHEKWIDTQGMASGAVHCEIAGHSTYCTLSLETSPNREGPWSPLVDFLNTSTTYLTAEVDYSSPSASQKKYERFIRWKVSVTPMGQMEWVTFKLTGVFKPPVTR
jgi:hypothetical protein